MDVNQAQIDTALSGVVFEPFRILPSFVTGFMGYNQFVARIAQLLDQRDRMLNPLALNDTGGL